MANEQHRAQRIQTEFQKLLAELKKQDEELEAACAQAGISLDELPRVPAPPEYLQRFEAVAEERRLELLRASKPVATPRLSGMVLRV